LFTARACHFKLLRSAQLPSCFGDLVEQAGVDEIFWLRLLGFGIFVGEKVERGLLSAAD